MNNKIRKSWFRGNHNFPRTRRSIDPPGSYWFLRCAQYLLWPLGTVKTRRNPKATLSNVKSDESKVSAKAASTNFQASPSRARDIRQMTYCQWSQVKMRPKNSWPADNLHVTPKRQVTKAKGPLNLVLSPFDCCWSKFAAFNSQFLLCWSHRGKVRQKVFRFGENLRIFDAPLDAHVVKYLVTGHKRWTKREFFRWEMRV